jgi:hypothetical protein
VLGLVRWEAEEDLGGDVVGQRAWRRHSALGSGFGVGIGDEPERVS